MHKEFPKISIVTPSFNQAVFLEATIQSVLSQNYPNLEYIIIDGGSRDGSIDIIKKYEKSLHYWCSEPDGGQYDAINKGFRHATGDIMGWLNSDDMHFPWTLKTVASILSDLTTVNWLTTLYAGWWDYHGFPNGFTLLPGFSKEAFLDGCSLPWNKKTLGWIQQESTFWRKSLWERTGSSIDTNYKLAGDFDLWSKFYLHAELYGVSAPLAGFRSQANQKSSGKDQYVSEAVKSLEHMRSVEMWSSNHSRDFLRGLKVSKIPKLRNLLLPLVAYEGKRIVRMNADLPSSRWKIESYHFFNDFVSKPKSG
jgi:glycosyltransferase involved in cell wall biosynthesis